jgi:hypothetical protein
MGVVLDFLFDKGVFGGGRQIVDLAQAAHLLHGGEDAGAAHFGVGAPFDEFEEELFVGMVVVAFEAGFLDFHTAGLEMAATETDDVLGQITEGFALLLEGFGSLFITVHEELGVIKSQHAEERIGHVFRSTGQITGIGGQFALLFEELAAMEPVAVAAVFPFVDVVGDEGAAIEVLGQDGFDFGHLVEGGDEVLGGGAIIESLVDAVAPGAGGDGRSCRCGWWSRSRGDQ